MVALCSVTPSALVVLAPSSNGRSRSAAAACFGMSRTRQPAGPATHSVRNTWRRHACMLQRTRQSHQCPGALPAPAVRGGSIGSSVSRGMRRDSDASSMRMSQHCQRRTMCMLALRSVFALSTSQSRSAPAATAASRQRCSRGLGAAGAAAQRQARQQHAASAHGLSSFCCSCCCCCTLRQMCCVSCVLRHSTPHLRLC